MKEENISSVGLEPDHLPHPGEEAHNAEVHKHELHMHSHPTLAYDPAINAVKIYYWREKKQDAARSYSGEMEVAGTDVVVRLSRIPGAAIDSGDQLLRLARAMEQAAEAIPGGIDRRTRLNDAELDQLAAVIRDGLTPAKEGMQQLCERPSPVRFDAASNSLKIPLTRHDKFEQLGFEQLAGSAGISTSVEAYDRTDSMNVLRLKTLEGGMDSELLERIVHFSLAVQERRMSAAQAAGLM